MIGIRAQATRVGNHWAIQAEHDGHRVLAHSRRFDHVEEMVRRAFDLEGIAVGEQPMEVVRMKKAPGTSPAVTPGGPTSRHASAAESESAPG